MEKHSCVISIETNRGAFDEQSDLVDSTLIAYLVMSLVLPAMEEVQVETLRRNRTSKLLYL